MREFGFFEEGIDYLPEELIVSDLPTATVFDVRAHVAQKRVETLVFGLGGSLRVAGLSEVAQHVEVKQSGE